MNSLFSPFPELHSLRCDLRRMTEEHLAGLYNLRKNEALMKYIHRPPAKNMKDVRALLKMIDDKITSENGINWGIFEKGKNKLIGTIGIVKIDKENKRGEVGYMLDTNYQNTGIISETLQEVLRFAFERLSLNCIEAMIDTRNKASQKLSEKNNFTKDAHMRDYVFANGKYYDFYIYTLLKKEFYALPKSDNVNQ